MVAIYVEFFDGDIISEFVTFDMSMSNVIM